MNTTNFLEKSFHRAQARLRTRQGVGVSLGQSAFAPFFDGLRKQRGATQADLPEMLQHQNKRRHQLGMVPHAKLPRNYQPVPDNAMRASAWRQRFQEVMA